ncbi:hypothetical protein L218DRAFT_1082513 [Marasmius fiardii PR-910]|nr:hypothetical protein L218DRAFT_1082513 [Marasmius fiardii PR-910]
MAFVGTSGVSIEGGAYNSVAGNQNIRVKNTIQIVQEEQKGKERTIYEEFEYIKLGHNRRVRDIELELENDLGTRTRIARPLLADMKICVAELHGEMNQRYTVISYGGPQGEKVWERDFITSSRVRDTKHMQLFGINRSDIPMLIFHDELVPVGYIWNQLSKLGRCYLSTLSSRSNLECQIMDLWMDPKRGTFICGVPVRTQASSFHEIPLVLDNTIPSSVELLQEEVLWRYLYHNLPLQPHWDRNILFVLERQFRGYFRHRKRLGFKPAGEIVVSSSPAGWNIPDPDEEEGRSPCLRFAKDSPSDSPSIVFELDDHPEELMVELTTLPSSRETAWLSQTSSVFHRLGFSKNVMDLPEYSYVQQYLTLFGPIELTVDADQRRKDYGLPIYLIIPPPSGFNQLKNCSNTSLHVWSKHKNGSDPIPEETCRRLGLPTTLHFHRSTERYYWPNEVYELVRKWQVGRGFNPETTEFAEYCGYAIFEPIPPDPSRFTQLDEELSQSNITGVVPDNRHGESESNSPHYAP